MITDFNTDVTGADMFGATPAERELKAKKELAEEVTRDFEERRNERRRLETGWRLNMNFLCGNQYCGINASGELEDEKAGYFWQPRRVFNYIAPMIELRCSKLARLKPTLAVRAATGEESDINTARLATSVLEAACDKINITDLVAKATLWAETCGTAFYKVLWDNDGGNEVGLTEEGKKVYEGDVRVAVLSPFEIYPFSLAEEDISAQPSIIHARAVPVQDIYLTYGVRLEGKDIKDFALAPYAVPSFSGEGSQNAAKCGYEVVIERYTRPTADMPDGRFTVAAGGELLYDGVLPYVNSATGGRSYPFIKQTSMQFAGSFFGTSVIERMIPVQRAYNAVRNRKHEFLNRISMGTVAVEDGSVDTDELIEDGLRPGKILVYRQGSNPPEMLTLGTLPEAFEREEETLQDEFYKISGTGDITQNGDSFSSVTSATGLQLIIEQDESRLNVCYESIKNALKEAGKLILRLYRQFATDARLVKCAGENGKIQLLFFKGSDITSDDVVLEADGELTLTPAERRTVVYELISNGLLSDSEGKLPQGVKNKVLQYIGYDCFSGERDLDSLHAVRAGEENVMLQSGGAEVKEYDDHNIHIREHTAFLLSGAPDKEQEKRICAHINSHKLKMEEK